MDDDTFELKTMATQIPITLALGTVLKVIFLKHNNKYLIEDIYYYQGRCLESCSWKYRLGQILDSMPQFTTFDLCLPNIYNLNVAGCEGLFAQRTREEPRGDRLPPPKNVHHYEYKSFTKNLPILVSNGAILLKPPPPPSRSEFTQHNSSTVCRANDEANSLRRQTVGRQHKSFVVERERRSEKSATFWVTANPKYDIYKIHVVGEKEIGTMLITTLETSKWMNRLFRNIRETDNIDYIEESDDEDFENGNPLKYVNLEKKIKIECVYHFKFKKWIPLRVSPPHYKICSWDDAHKITSKSRR
jgi:hypothetical protein